MSLLSILYSITTLYYVLCDIQIDRIQYVVIFGLCLRIYYIDLTIQFHTLRRPYYINLTKQYHFLDYRFFNRLRQVLYQQNIKSRLYYMSIQTIKVDYLGIVVRDILQFIVKRLFYIYNISDYNIQSRLLQWYNNIKDTVKQFIFSIAT